MKRFRTVNVKYRGRNPNTKRIEKVLNQFAAEGYTLINRTERPPSGCASISSLLFGGKGRTSLTFEYRD